MNILQPTNILAPTHLLCGWLKGRERPARRAFRRLVSRRNPRLELGPSSSTLAFSRPPLSQAVATHLRPSLQPLSPQLICPFASPSPSRHLPPRRFWVLPRCAQVRSEAPCPGSETRFEKSGGDALDVKSEARLATSLRAVASVPEIRRGGGQSQDVAVMPVILSRNAHTCSREVSPPSDGL